MAANNRNRILTHRDTQTRLTRLFCMSATALDLSQIRTDALASAASFRELIGVYSVSEVDQAIVDAGGGGGGGAWGGITGTLSDQTDLQSALDAKAASSHTHAASDIASGTIDQARLGTGSAGAGAKFLADDQTYKTIASGSGDVAGPASATDNAIARFDSTTGKLLQNSGVTVDDSDNMSMAGRLDVGGVNAGAKLNVYGSGTLCTLQNVSGTGVGLNFVSAAITGSYTVFQASIATSGNLAYYMQQNGAGNCEIVMYSVGAGDIQTRITTGGQWWSYGIDNSDSDAFVIANSNFLHATTSALRIAVDKSAKFFAPVLLGVYTFATVPTASSYTGHQITISDRSYKSAYSNGTNWLFCSNDTIIS